MSTTKLLQGAKQYAVKAGGKVRLTRKMASTLWVRFFGIDFPYDIRANVETTKRPVDLGCEAWEAATNALVFSYPVENADERVESGRFSTNGTRLVWPIPASHPREHAALIRFGAGQAQHVVEIDIVEGTAFSLPTQTAEVSLLQYAWYDIVTPDPPGQVSTPFALQSQASAGSLPHRARAIKTQQALFLAGQVGEPDLTMEVREDAGVDVEPDGEGTRDERATETAERRKPRPPRSLPRLADARSEAELCEAAEALLTFEQPRARTEAEAFRLATERVLAWVPPAGKGRGSRRLSIERGPA